MPGCRRPRGSNSLGFRVPGFPDCFVTLSIYIIYTYIYNRGYTGIMEKKVESTN